MTEIYIDDQSFEELAIRLAAITPCPFAGYVTANQMKIALGEHGGVWPASIKGDVATARAALH